MEFIQIGEKLGLIGEDLRTFIETKEREKFERDERAAEREARKIEKEIELEIIKRETELQKYKEFGVGCCKCKRIL